MRKPIPSLIVVAVVFLAIGVLDVVRGLAPLFQSASHPRLAGDDVLVLAIGIAALIGGVFLLRGWNWARWLLAGWMLLHVVISVGKPTELAAHVVIFGLLTFLLFRSRATEYFHQQLAERSTRR